MKKKYWLDERRNVMLLIKIFAGLCVGVLAIDAGFHRHEEFFWKAGSASTGSSASSPASSSCSPRRSCAAS